MTIEEAIKTLLGAIMFPFIVRLVWDELVKIFGPLGGWISAGLIVGTMWILNHHLGLINQSGEVWIDMALAVASGVFIATALESRNIKKSLPVLLGCCIGGVLAGIVLTNL
ncbi:hypothetical protein H8S10_14610 [Clostridium sp. NSJ-49]|uniref:Lin0368 family putative glycerol transporter subunit n=1 Tax=Clostridium TaxID=1485 RepID=UPI00164CCFB3|nr:MULTISPECIES: hypothetical protein [unclassified Clostridium]MBC5626682.1 hypothetical protein [Clostridium sp. NSJ-49]MCD2502410.1 hypothetical protein [Clostridium sp. NSJ-145]MDU6341084.1 hypothetical protein [Clostridium sp.]